MTRGKKLLGVTLLTAIIITGLVVGRFVLKSGEAATGVLQIDSLPRARVFLDDNEVGQTPYVGEKLKVGEYRLKLTAGSGVVGTFSAWETKVKVTADLLTYVSRELGTQNTDSAGQLLYLERLSALGSSAEAAVVSDPDGAVVVIDSLEKGRAPLLLTDQRAGDHVMTISSPGFADQVVRGKFILGFRLNAVVKLKKLVPVSTGIEPVATPSAQVPPPATGSARITVRDNPLGFLRVRSGPDFTANEIARIYPGEQYPLLGQSEGWVKIKLAGQGGSGWVSDQYVFIYQ